MLWSYENVEQNTPDSYKFDTLSFSDEGHVAVDANRNRLASTGSFAGTGVEKGSPAADEAYGWESKMALTSDAKSSHFTVIYLSAII